MRVIGYGTLGHVRGRLLEREQASAFNFYRASVDKDYSPGNKLISGLRDSAVSWAIILPLYWYCEKGAAAA